MILQEFELSAPALNALACIHTKQHQESHRDPQSHNTHLTVWPAVDQLREQFPLRPKGQILKTN